MTTQEFLTFLCAALEISAFALFTIEFIRFSITRDLTPSVTIPPQSVQKSALVVATSSTGSKSSTAQPAVQETEAQTDADPKSIPTNTSVVIDEQQSLTSTQQQPQSTKSKSSRKSQQPNKAQSSSNRIRPQKPCEKLRQRCAENGISWKKASSDGKNLTTKQMINALTEKNIYLSDIVSNQRRNSPIQHKNAA